MVRISEVMRYWMEEDCPLIAISGEWLREFGFDIGGRIIVDVTTGRIIIKPVDTEE
ncbi:MAG: type I toxin-antitoxin system SymE family toxin [Clostridia bacterium]|nr:type I toxin-antitoxin system SymE family toxin [Clostridia bacterium]